MTNLKPFFIALTVLIAVSARSCWTGTEKPEQLRISYHAYNALSELTHVAGSQVSGYVEGAFSDYNLAYEAHSLADKMGTGVENLDLTPPKVNPYNDPRGSWSDYYHGIVKLYCKRTERP